jgi:integral membrane protein (TIGR01906 family)
VRVLRCAMVSVVACLLPVVLVANAFRLLAAPWYVEREVSRLEPDRLGLGSSDRVDLATLGLRTIRPGGEGISALEQATLPDGTHAFGEREVRHMRDVRRLFVPLLHLELGVVLGLAGLAALLARSARWRTLVPRILRAGGIVTLGVGAFLVPFILFGFDRFFVGFHEVFFPDDSWRFADTDTLRRLYPDAFWERVSFHAAALTVMQSVALVCLGWLWLRRIGSRT